jgi:predicted transcriptional regulator
LAKRRSVAKTTIQTLITRLADKGWLTYRAEGKTFIYSASVERQSAIKTALRRLVDVAFKGSPAGLVHTLLADPELTPEEATRIRQMIAEAENKP